MNYKEKLHTIKAFIFDFDGVISDGGVWIVNEDLQLRKGNVKDGYALQYAIKKGYKIAVISGGRCQSITARMKLLGVHDVFLQSSSKIEVFQKYITDNQLKKEEILYMGDDIPDYPVMLESGVATCPADAAEEIKAVADYISFAKGGEGCVRDIIEQVLRLHGNWFHPDAVHW